MQQKFSYSAALHNIEFWRGLPLVIHIICKVQIPVLPPCVIGVSLIFLHQIDIFLEGLKH
jgi:hypothetical protein